MPYVGWREHPVYFVVWLSLIPFWREFHFYWVHRFIHWKPYDISHYLHHKNTNPGPWSGMAMHPIEHLLYFSVVLIHFIVPSHPIHFLFNSQHTALTHGRLSITASEAAPSSRAKYPRVPTSTIFIIASSIAITVRPHCP